MEYNIRGIIRGVPRGHPKSKSDSELILRPPAKRTLLNGGAKIARARAKLDVRP